MFKVSVPNNMKISYDSHDLAFTQLAGFDTFPGAIAQLMCLQFFDKCFIKIVNVTENINKFVFNVIRGFFLYLVSRNN